MENTMKRIERVNNNSIWIRLMGRLFKNTRRFRKSRLGWRWACEYHPKVDGLDEYLLWQAFKIK